MTNQNWPLISWQVAFNIDANDAVNLPSWTDLTPRLRQVGCHYGRQYELDLNEAGEMTAVLDDEDEMLNPATIATVVSQSGFRPAPMTPMIRRLSVLPVLPYRRVAHQAMWPPAPVGAAVNLLNATWGLSVYGYADYDPSFESYVVGAAVSWVSPVGGLGGSPSVTNGAPHDGANCLIYAPGVVGAGVSWLVPCIPGQQYTTSVWWRQSSAGTQKISVVGVADGTYSSTVGSYVRLSVTFTATQPLHTAQVVLTTSGSTTTRVDSIQHEPGASASAFAATGPVIYGVFTGYVERWPSDWTHHGLRGRAQVTCTDAFAALSNIGMSTEYVAAVLATKPDYYWPLWETSSSAASFAEISGSGGPPLVKTDGKYGAATTYTPGSSTEIVGDQGGVGVLLGGPNGTCVAVSVLQTGLSNTPTINIGGSPPTSYSAAIWVVHSQALSGSAANDILTIGDSVNNNTLLNLYDFAATISAYIVSAAGSQTCGAHAADAWNDGRPHLYVVVNTITSSTATTNLYVDGVVKATTSVSAASFTPPYKGNIVQVGGLIASTNDAPNYTESGLPDGLYAHVALWNRALSGAEVASLWTAGNTGQSGETSGARIGRYLAANYAGAYSAQAGASTMAASPITRGQSLLSACQDITATEGGNFWADGTGTIRFTARTDRCLKTSPAWTLGEQELPYEDGIAYDMDDTHVANDVTVTREGGIIAVGGDIVSAAASRQRYFKRSYEITVGCATDAEAQDHANWLFYTSKDAYQRVAHVAVKPSANPSLWPFALGVRIGDRVTVKRRTTAGLTMSGDFFVERIEHNHQPGEWVTAFELSPVKLQAGILDDATYGVLDYTLVLAF